MTSAPPSPAPESPSKMTSNKSEDRSISPDSHSDEGSQPPSHSLRQEKPESAERGADSDSSSESGSVSPEQQQHERDSESAQPEAGPSTSTPAPAVSANAHVQGDWQAIWSPQHNAYYFYNMRTHETTWTNPLDSSSAPESSSTSATGTTSTSNAGPSSRAAIEAAALAAGIDPELAFLDPSLLAGSGAGPSSTPAGFSYTAKFNARTGAFAKPDARNPEHVSEYERMRRMSSFYFDVDKWQEEVDQRHAEEAEAGKKRKKPSKKDLEMYKERKKQKKLAKTAWLRT